MKFVALVAALFVLFLSLVNGRPSLPGFWTKYPIPDQVLWRNGDISLEAYDATFDVPDTYRIGRRQIKVGREWEIRDISEEGNYDPNSDDFVSFLHVTHSCNLNRLNKRPIDTNAGGNGEFGKAFYTLLGSDTGNASAVGNGFNWKPNNGKWLVIRLVIDREAILNQLATGDDREDILYYLTHHNLGDNLSNEKINAINAQGKVIIFPNKNTRVRCGRQTITWRDFQYRNPYKRCTGAKNPLLIIGPHKAAHLPLRQYAFRNDMMRILNGKATLRHIQYDNRARRVRQEDEEEEEENSVCLLTPPIEPTIDVSDSGSWRELITRRREPSTEYEVRYVEEAGRNSLVGILLRWQLNYFSFPDLDDLRCDQNHTDLLYFTHNPDNFPLPTIDYVSCFNNWAGIPEWTLHLLSPNMLGDLPRRDVTPWRSRVFLDESYDRSGDPFVNPAFDRGHLVPAGDFGASRGAMDTTYHVANCAPQMASFNRGAWRNVEMEFRRDVLRNNRPLLVLTQVGGGWTRTKEQTTREYIPGKDVWVPSYWAKTAWNTEGEMFQRVMLPSETLADADLPEDENALVRELMENDSRIPPIPLPPADPKKILFWKNDIQEMRTYCNPFEFNCRLDLLPDCNAEQFNMTVQLELYAYDKEWSFFPVAPDEGPCPPECLLFIDEEIEWFAELTTNRFFGTSKTLLESTALKCMQKPDRERCFRSGQKFRKEMLHADLADKIRDDPIVGRFQTRCGVGRKEDVKAPFTKIPGSSKERDRKDSPSTARIKSWVTN